MRRLPLRIALAVVALALTIGAVGCTLSAPNADPDISGVIDSLTPTHDGITMLVMAVDEGTSAYDIASVFVGTETEVMLAEDGGLVAGTYGDIANGARVDVWFEGPVAESYPVQATAGTVVVLGY